MRKKPSEVKDSALALSLLMYPFVTLTPRMQISPSVPVGSWVPVGERMRTSTPWPMPTVPGLRAAGGSGLEVIWWAASVIA